MTFFFIIDIIMDVLIAPIGDEGMAEQKKKRVACLYRVSTKGQVDQNDIPLQRNACREFINNQQDWVLVKEYYEKGVSGYKLSAEDRDEMQRAKSDALNGLFDVLLVFMFDRLGRREDETPFIVEWFVKNNIEVWSTQEGQQRFNDHIDKLLNYLRFWQSSGESYKTSVRVNESHKQLTQAGIYRGGTPPYGYKLVPSGRINKKGKELLTIVPDEIESEIVKTIFEITRDKHWGGKKIAEYLNENAIPSRRGRTWSGKTINTLLANPVYKGYMVYGRTKADNNNKYQRQEKSNWTISDRIPEIAIVDEQLWEQVRIIKQSKMPVPIDPNNTRGVVVNSSSPLLFTGIISCGHCGSAVTTTYNTKTWKNKDGTVKKYKAAKYRCSGKALGSKQCDGQTIYGKNKIEDVVLSEVKTYLKRLSKVDLADAIQKMQSKTLDNDKKQLAVLQKNNENNYSELSVLQDEITKSLLGKSAFKPEVLSSLIDKKENEIAQNADKISELEDKIKAGSVELSSAIELQNTIPHWDEVFESADTDRKKVLLRSIIDSIVVRRDSIEINVKLHLQQFLQDLGDNQDSPMGSETKTTRESIGVVNTTPNIVFEEILKATYKVA